MDVISISLSAVVLITVWLYFRKNDKRDLINQMPGPKVYPFIGNLMELLVPREEFMPMIAERVRKYGTIYRTWLGPLPAVHLASPELIEPILSNNKKFMKKGTLYKFLYPWLGTGLLTSSGQKWFTHRKMITPTFHFKILDTFLDIFYENSEILVKRLEDKAKSKEEFDVYSFITSAALDIICETAMGTKIQAQSREQSPYVNSIYKLSTATVMRGIRLWLHPDIIFKFSNLGKEYYTNLKVVHGFTEGVIQDRKTSRNVRKESNRENENDVGTKKRQAFLDLLLKESEGAGAVKLTDEELREEVDTFMFEGHDTTTAGICWALYLLGHNPKIQEEVYEELTNIFGDDPKRAVEMKDLNEMKLLERVIKETLRLYPSVPLISRLLDEDIQLGKYLVPAGTTAAIHIYHVHRDPKIYPDPEKFDPDRFLPENVQKRHPYAYVPFSAGPRNCIGQKFALLEEKVVLSTLLRSYKFESTEKREDLVLMSELILRPKSGIRLKISKRV